MTAIVDYGVGNLFSLKSSFEAIGEQITVTSDAEVLAAADRIVLPGVGAFGDAAQKLRDSGLDKVLISLANSGKPLMGICLGMQLLFEKSCEYGEHAGLSLIPGEIRPISEVVPPELKIPHMGWNALIRKQSPIFKYTDGDAHMYFVHSFSAFCKDEYIIASAEYGGLLTAAVQRDNVFGCQFHPEKSGDEGLKILKAFCEVRQ